MTGACRRGLRGSEWGCLPCSLPLPPLCSAAEVRDHATQRSYGRSLTFGSRRGPGDPRGPALQHLPEPLLRRPAPASPSPAAPTAEPRPLRGPSRHWTNLPPGSPCPFWDKLDWTPPLPPVAEHFKTVMSLGEMAQVTEFFPLGLFCGNVTHPAVLL